MSPARKRAPHRRGAKRRAARNGYLGNAKDAIEAFIPPKTVLDRPIDDLVKEAKGRSAEKNATLDHPHRETPAPELGR